MLSDFKKAAKNSIVYSLGNIATKLIGLILMPLFTDVNYLSETDYGVLADVEIITQLLIAILGISLYQSLVRWYWDSKIIDKQKQIVFTVLVSIAVFSFFAYIPYRIFINQISFFLLHSTSHTYLFKLVFWTAFIQALGVIPFTLLKLQSKPLLFTISNIIKLVITLFLTIYFVAYEKRNVEGIFEAQLIGNLLLFIILLPYLSKNIEFIFNFKELKRMFEYGYPLILASISGVLLSVFDRFGLTKVKGLEETAIYGIGFKFANTIKLVVVTSIQMAITPMIYQKMYDPDAKVFYKNTMFVVASIVIIFVLGISLFSYEIVIIFTRNDFFLQAIYIIPILNYALFFGAIKDIAVIGLNITKKTKIIVTLLTFVATANFILNYFFIPIWGIYGASISTLLSQVLFFALVLYYSQKNYPIPYEFKRIILMIIASSALIAVGFLTNSIGLLFSIPAKLILVIIFSLFVVKVIMSKEEVKHLEGFYQKWKNPSKFKENIKSMKDD